MPKCPYFICQLDVLSSGSGKSTFARDLRLEFSSLGSEIDVYSSDALRLELYGDENDQTHNAEVFEELHKRMLAALKEGKDVIYDATNLTVKDRMKFLKKIPENWNVTKHCHILPISYEEAVKRQDLRERKVPAEVIKRQMCKFQTPWFHEGWNHISVQHGYFHDEINLDEILVKNGDISHDNPNHSHTIGDHCQAALAHAMDMGYNSAVQDAAKYHDIGKFFTKDFKDSRGNPSEIAHFYGHQNYGAYLVLMKDFASGTWNLKLSVLICYHMEEFLRKNKVDKFYESLEDEDLVRDLKLLHECDLAAH